MPCTSVPARPRQRKGKEPRTSYAPPRPRLRTYHERRSHNGKALRYPLAGPVLSLACCTPRTVHAAVRVFAAVIKHRPLEVRVDTLHALEGLVGLAEAREGVS